ncbi:MAG: flagellar basal body L-ring protein FlgH [Candidatus Caldatribacteriota bacterium]
MNLLYALALSLLFSCSHYVDSFHRQIDREERSKNVSRNRPTDPASDYQRYKNRWDTKQDKRPIQNPQTYSLGRPSGRVEPTVKRDYQPQRYRASDFRDQDDSGSLWANQGSSSSLFTYQNDKRVGDIVILNVLEGLRNQISNELKSHFPDRKKAKTNETPAAPGPASTPVAAAATANADSDMDMKVYDKISGMIIEELNKDYLLIRGRKEVIYKKEKRSIEVQALVSRRDIMENDYVNSDRLLESKVFILRDRQ